MRVLAGTSGWSFAAWKGPFYPEDLPAGRMLSTYASRLPTVEVNNTFYRMPSRAMLAAWLPDVPPGFRFALKAPQRITHKLRLLEAGEPTAIFLAVAATLGDALGPLLFQLPPWVKKDLPRLQAFLALLPAGVRAAFEFRHVSWFDAEVMSALSGAGAALCVAEGEGGATPFVATASFGYLRLRRPDYDAAAIATWAARIRSTPWRETFVFFKHEDGARGPAYAALLNRLGGEAGTAAGVGEGRPA